jgi:hypothetical protein
MTKRDGARGLVRVEDRGSEFEASRYEVQIRDGIGKGGMLLLCIEKFEGVAKQKAEGIRACIRYALTRSRVRSKSRRSRR